MRVTVEMVADDEHIEWFKDGISDFWAYLEQYPRHLPKPKITNFTVEGDTLDQYKTPEPRASRMHSGDDDDWVRRRIIDGKLHDQEYPDIFH